MGNFFRIPADNRDLNYVKYLINGSKRITDAEEFDSNNTKILTCEEVIEKLIHLDYIKEQLEG